jgi:hypothetical protein
MAGMMVTAPMIASAATKTVGTSCTGLAGKALKDCQAKHQTAKAPPAKPS